MLTTREYLQKSAVNFLLMLSPVAVNLLATEICSKVVFTLAYFYSNIQGKENLVGMIFSLDLFRGMFVLCFIGFICLLLTSLLNLPVLAVLIFIGVFTVLQDPLHGLTMLSLAASVPFAFYGAWCQTKLHWWMSHEFIRSKLVFFIPLIFGLFFSPFIVSTSLWAFWEEGNLKVYPLSGQLGYYVLPVLILFVMLMYLLAKKKPMLEGVV